MKKKNLVIGIIRGYSYDKIEPFVASLKKTNFNGELCLLTNNVPSETISELKKQGVRCEEISYRGGNLNSWCRFWPGIKPVAPFLPKFLLRAILKKILPLLKVRFLHSKDFLIKNIDTYENVLLTDVRDVFFQLDPFVGNQHDKIQCYEEFEIIGEELLYNAPWIKSMFGEHAIDSFAEEKILCAGTILGPIDQMIQFLNEFEKILIQAKDLKDGGSDQGIYNYLIRKYLFNQIAVVKYNEGEVLTISSNQDYSNNLKNNYLYNSTNQIVPVIHQYDRSEQITKAMELQLKNS